MPTDTMMIEAIREARKDLLIFGSSMIQCNEDGTIKNITPQELYKTSERE